MASRLPNELLAAIFERAGAAEGPSVTLVCKRWSRVFYSTPGIWRQFAVAVPDLLDFPEERQQQWAAARLGLLRRVAGMVESLRVFRGDGLQVVGAGSNAQPGDFVSCLTPQAAREVCLLGFQDLTLPAIAVAALAPLTCLERLALAGRKLPCNTAAMLRQLSPSPVRLNLRTEQLPSAVVEALPHLLQLTSLQLDCDGHLPLFEWPRLSVLQHLQHLGLSEWHWLDTPPLQPPCPTSFAVLRSFQYTSSQGLQLAGVHIGNLQYQTTACQFECPREEEDYEAEERERTQRRMDQTLTLQGVPGPQRLRPLLGSLLTHRMPLRGLSLSLPPTLPADAVAGCEPHLSSLRALTLAQFSAQPGSSPGVLQALMAQAPALTSIRAERCLAGSIPASLAQRAGLKELSLAFNGLSDLPGGPYLSGLTSLNLLMNLLSALPSSLAAATALEELDVTLNNSLPLTPADMDALLASHPRLRHLRIFAGFDRSEVCQHVWRTAPHIRLT
ncbi:hypothetical protein ABPG75_011319 [Micractinium tetrahymenae]